MKTRTAVITGATSGIGLAAAKLLAQKDIRIIGVGRDETRCEKAKSEILTENNQARVDFVVGNLWTTSNVREIASEIKHHLAEADNQLDILMLVAGTVSTWHVNTPEAYELQFAVNHLAPFLLTHELLPNLMQAASARVLIVSSGSHYRTKIRWHDVMMRKRYHCLAAYKQAKLCNALFATELARRLTGTSVWTYTIDPGLTNTGIGLKNTTGIERFVWKMRQRKGVTPDVPARYMVAIATEPQYAERTGLYWKEGHEKLASTVARDPEQAAKLWALSEKLCGLKQTSIKAENTLIQMPA